MRRALGYLWGALLPLSVIAEPEYLSYDDLLSSWSAYMQEAGYPACSSIAEVFSYLSPEDIDEAAGGCDDGFRYFVPGQPAKVTLPRYSQPVLPFQIEFFRTNGYPAGLLVDFSHASNHFGYISVPARDVSSVSVFRYPSPWDTIREALYLGQSGHLPISLACLTYPGFSDWCANNVWGSFLVPNVAGSGSELSVRTRCVTWNRVVQYWAPQVIQSLGYHGATNYLRNVFPTCSFGWQPYLCSRGRVLNAPNYPGPLWYQNANYCNGLEPDYALDFDALVTIQEECDDNGIPNPFGDMHLIPYVVAPVDDEGRAKVDFKFKLDALVVGGSE